MIWSTERKTEYYRLALLRVVMGLFASAGMVSDSSFLEKMPRNLRNAILLILRPAESAARRLIDVAARSLGEVTYLARPKSSTSGTKGTGRKTGRRAPQFSLIDSRKFYAELYPNARQRPSKPKRDKSSEPQIQVRIAGFDGQPDFIIWSEPKALPMPDDEINAGAICRRLMALKLALEDLPAQAKRYVWEIAKRKAAPPGPSSRPPLRFGLPPGYRKKHIHEVDDILWECHCLVRREPPKPDTS